MLKAYVKILPLVGKHADIVLGQHVEITEKIDGSQFVFGKDEEGNLHFRSKGAVIDGAAPPTLFAPAVAHVHQIAHRIAPNTAYYGETLSKPRHNSITYDRVPKGHIMLYGMTDFARTEAETNYAELASEATYLEMEVVPLLYRGMVESLDLVKTLLEGDSSLGGGLREGVVIKRYNYPVEFNGQFYPFAALKFVSEKFKEVHASNPDWRKAKDAKGELYELFRTEARWLKAVQTLRDNGELVGEPKDIGKLVPQIIKDTVEEEKENFKERLYEIFQKEWKGTLVRGFPEWYKQLLLQTGAE